MASQNAYGTPKILETSIWNPAPWGVQENDEGDNDNEQQRAGPEAVTKRREPTSPSFGGRGHARNVSALDNSQA
jgi:hypothetical protein